MNPLAFRQEDALRRILRVIREILDGKHDNLPESAFLFVGTIDEAVEKAKKLS